MSDKRGWRARIANAVNRYQAVTAGMGKKATAFTSQPEPRTIGTFARGRQLSAGNFLFAGYLVEAPDASLWDLPMPDAAFEIEVHGFAWIDDLAAVSDLPARHRAQTWTHEWAARFGRGPGARMVAGPDGAAADAVDQSRGDAASQPGKGNVRHLLPRHVASGELPCEIMESSVPRPASFRSAWRTCPRGAGIAGDGTASGPVASSTWPGVRRAH